MLLPATMYDPVRCRATFFFCLPFSDIPQRELRAIVKMLQFSTSGIISVKAKKQTVLIKVYVKQLNCAMPLTGMATRTSFEHNVIYRAVRNAESAVDSIYDVIMQMHALNKQLKGDLQWQNNLPARLC